MNGEEFFLQVFNSLWPEIPVVLAALVGMIVSLMHLKMARRPAMFGLFGFGLLFLSRGCNPVAAALVSNALRNDYRSARLVFGFYHLGFALVTALALVFLMIAAFSGRKVETP